MIKYRVWIRFNEIKPVEVERETKTSVWVDGTRNAKMSNHYCYFGTWEEAHAFLLAKAEEDCTRIRRQLEYANSKLGNVKGMKKPERTK